MQSFYLRQCYRWRAIATELAMARCGIAWFASRSDRALSVGGFLETGPFGDDAADPANIFMEKRLGERRSIDE